MANAMNMDQMLDNYMMIDGLLQASRNADSQAADILMGQTVRMNDHELRDYKAYADWLSLELSQSDWQFGTTLLYSQMTTLNDLVDNHWMYRAGQKAISYMNRHMVTDFYIPPARGNWQPRSTMLNTRTQPEIPIVEVYPNSASEMLTFEFHLSQHSQANGTMAIYDITNRLVQELVISDRNQMFTLDSRQWQSGLYMFIVKIPGEEEHVGRFEVIH